MHRHACTGACAFFAGSIVCIDPCYTLLSERVRGCVRWCRGACLAYAPAHAGCSERLSGAGVLSAMHVRVYAVGWCLWRPRAHFAYTLAAGCVHAAKNMAGLNSCHTLLTCTHVCAVYSCSVGEQGWGNSTCIRKVDIFPVMKSNSRHEIILRHESLYDGMKSIIFRHEILYPPS